MHTLVLLRASESELLCRAGLVFDAAMTSVLKRAIRTLWIVLDDLDRDVDSTRSR